MMAFKKNELVGNVSCAVTSGDIINDDDDGGGGD